MTGALTLDAAGGRAAQLAALQWWVDSGVDAVVEDAPRRWLAPEAPTEAPGGAAMARPTASRAVETAGSAAIAAACTTLAELRAAIAAYSDCGLSAQATQPVFADGNLGAPLLLIGEAPGAEEDRVGRPFVGRAGQLLDRMLGAIGLDRSTAAITNVCYWRPPGNRSPSTEELLHCLPFVRRFIQLMQPRALLLLGATPTQALTGSGAGIMRLRGQWQQVEGVGALPTFHPAYLLRQPAQKALAWRDLLELRSKLNNVA